MCAFAVATPFTLVNWGCLAVTLVGMECLLRWRELFPSAQRLSKPVA